MAVMPPIVVLCRAMPASCSIHQRPKTLRGPERPVTRIPNRGTAVRAALPSRRSRSRQPVARVCAFAGSVILSHQAKDLAAAIFAAMICPAAMMQRWPDKITQRASRDPSPLAQDDIDSLAAVKRRQASGLSFQNDRLEMALPRSHAAN
jgi:hypothetical protein